MSLFLSLHQTQARSVQEKLAEAILNMTECISEPELSDTSTEEDEFMSVVSRWDAPGEFLSNHLQLS